MQQLRTVVVASDEEQRVILSLQVNGSGLATVVLACDSLPGGSKDEALRRIAEIAPDVIVVDVLPQDAPLASQAVELMLAASPTSVVFAVGDLTQSNTIITVMRAGAKEYFGRPTTMTVLSDALVRTSTQQNRLAPTAERGKVFAFVNAKGGSGSTTIAVNTALSLLRDGPVAIVDLAPLGHVALQLNLKPAFSVRDALASLHRLDTSLLQSIVTRHSTGVHVLAGSFLGAGDLQPAEIARLFDVLVSSYRYVIVDVSTRIDAVAQHTAENSEQTFLVATPDVPALWSAGRLEERFTTARKRLRLVVNRFRKIPGLADADIERLTRLTIAGKIPNNFLSLASSLDRGVPVCQQNHSELARSFAAFADSLRAHESGAHESTLGLFTTKAGS